MKQLIAYCRDYWKAAIQPFYLLAVLLLTGILVWCNYRYGIDVRWAQGATSYGGIFARYYVLYASAFIGTFSLQFLFFPQHRLHTSPAWWLLILLAPAIMAFRASAKWFEPFIRATWSPPYTIFYLRSFGWLLRAACLILPVSLYWYIRDKNQQPLYGLQKPPSWHIYNWLLLLMIPLITVAALQPGLAKVYPRAHVLSAIPMPTFASHWYYLVFETTYGIDFFSIELFFRGFLILAFAKTCKQHIILPAAVFYCTIHFGKPTAECISSLFGGTLLGILAYRTRSIYGGLLLHLGLAWGMEIVSSLLR